VKITGRQSPSEGENMKILIAADGSACSKNAIEEFCRMFEKADNVDIKIASVYEGTIPLDAFGVVAENSEKSNFALKKRAEQVVTDAKNFIAERIPNARIETMVAMDLAERFIIENAEDWNPNLIVVGSHGRSFWGRMTIGSVSDAVIHHAPCPVLVARRKPQNPGTA
jgi:nucleotide-binding universal stress UspA family protein